MVAEQFTIWELFGGMLLFGVGGYLIHWGETKSKEMEVKNEIVNK